MARSKAQKALASGPSKIGLKARAAANQVKLARRVGIDLDYSVKKDPETRHLQTQQFGGKHHAPSTQGASKNAYGSMSDPSVGRHSLNNAMPKHGGGSSPKYGKGRERDVAGAYRDSVGRGRVGKHRKPGA